MPQHAGQHEAGGHRFGLAHAAVGVGQRELHEFFAPVVSVRFVEHHVERGKHAAVQALFAQLFQAGQRVAGLQQLDHLVEQARGRHVVEQRRHGLDRRACLGFDLEAQLGREAHRADDAHRVFAVARLGVADHAQQLLLGVFQAAVIVDHDLGLRVVVHRVDGEVATRGVFDLRTPDVVAQHAAFGVHHMTGFGIAPRQLALGSLLVAGHRLASGRIHHRAKGRDFDHLAQAAVLAAAPEHHVHDAKTPPDDEGSPEQAFHLLGRGVGGHVEILRPQAQQQVAHRTAHDVGLEAAFGQRVHHLDGAFVDQRRVDAVLCLADLDAFAQWGQGGQGGTGAVRFFGWFAQQLVEKLFDHVNSFKMRQWRSRAMVSSAAVGLVATGSVARSSSGRSLGESL